MAKVKEITVREFRNKFNNNQVLQEAFSTIKNATLVRSNDTSLVILDEESGIFYDVDYEINGETRQLVMRNFSPFVLKEEAVDLKESYTKAMNPDASEEESAGVIKKIVQYMVKTHFGGEKSRLIGEAKSKAYNKSIDRARKGILEDLNVFKSANRKLLNEVKSQGFYDRFVTKLNEKYLKDGVKVRVADKLNFHLIDKRNKSDKISESVYIKSLDRKTESLNEYFNPSDVVRNSPSFVEKLNKFMDDAYLVMAKDRARLEEAVDGFTSFASHWPVLYTISSERHQELAIRHFSNTISDKTKAKEYVTLYNSLVESEQFQKDQEAYLKKNYNWSIDDLHGIEKTRKMSESVYNTRILDDVRRAVTSVREKLDRIESVNVENYLKLAEDRFNSMLRSGRFNEEIFEQMTTDIFGDHNLVTHQEKEEIFSDPEFRSNEKKQTVSEDQIRTYELEAKAHKLVIEMRDLMPKVEKTLHFALEEDFDLLKSMIAINAIDETKLNAIEKLVTEIRKSTKSEKEEALTEDRKDAWCVVCGESITAQVSEALAAGKKSTPCPSCKTEMVISK